MDLNHQYAVHQRALIIADATDDIDERAGMLQRAALVAEAIGVFQNKLGAAAACAWTASHRGAKAASRSDPHPPPSYVETGRLSDRL